jgi:hypothetical protein
MGASTTITESKEDDEQEIFFDPVHSAGIDTTMSSMVFVNWVAT